MGRAFEQYEQVTAFLLNEFAAHFGLGRVEGKQIIHGSRSGTNWEIDGKGIRSPDGERETVSETIFNSESI